MAATLRRPPLRVESASYWVCAAFHRRNCAAAIIIPVTTVNVQENSRRSIASPAMIRSPYSFRPPPHTAGLGHSCKVSERRRQAVVIGAASIAHGRVAGAFEKEGRELPIPLTVLRSRPYAGPHIQRGDVAGYSAESCCHCGDHCVGCNEPVSRLRRLTGRERCSPRRALRRHWPRPPQERARRYLAPEPHRSPSPPEVRGLILSGGAVGGPHSDHIIGKAIADLLE
jgi:hypothetical protein